MSQPVKWSSHAIHRRIERFPGEHLNLPDHIVRVADKVPRGMVFKVSSDGVTFTCRKKEEHVLIMTVYRHE